MSAHPRVTTAGEERWEDVLESQRIFLAAGKERRKPAAVVHQEGNADSVRGGKESQPKHPVHVIGNIKENSATSVVGKNVDFVAPAIGFPKAPDYPGSLARQQNERDSTGSLPSSRIRRTRPSNETKSGIATIHDENTQRIASMSTAEIAAAREEIMSAFDPATLAFLKKRGKSKDDGRTSSEASRTSNTMAGSIDVNRIHTEDELLSAVESQGLESAKWASNLPTTKSGESISLSHRFDLEGSLVKNPDFDYNQLRGLHHHAKNPGAAGYTLSELLHLSRSTAIAQRRISLRALSGMLANRAAQIKEKKNTRTNANSNERNTGSVVPGIVK